MDFILLVNSRIMQSLVLAKEVRRERAKDELSIAICSSGITSLKQSLVSNKEVAYRKRYKDVRAFYLKVASVKSVHPSSSHWSSLGSTSYTVATLPSQRGLDVSGEHKV